MQIRLLFSSILFLVSWSISAHNPDISSTALIEQGSDKWLLQIRSSLTAFEYEIEKHFGKSSYKTPEEFQSLVIDFVRDNVSIQLNDGESIILKNGLVKLGHETSVTFQLEKPLKDIETIKIYNGCFSNIARNRSLVFVLKEGIEKKQFEINEENNHSLKLAFKNGRVVPIKISPETQNHASFLGIALSILGISLLGFIIFKRKQTKSVLKIN